MLTSLIAIASVLLELNKCPAVADGMELALDGSSIRISPGHIYINDALVSVPAQSLQAPAADQQSVHLLMVKDNGSCRWECFSPLRPHKADEVPVATLTQNSGSAPILRPVLQSDSVITTTVETANNRIALSHTLSILRSGGELNVVFWGDSITDGAVASDKEQAFPKQTVRLMHSVFPNVQINSTICGIPATNTKVRLPSAETDVFAHKPELVVVEFLNDFALDEQTLRRSYMQIIALAKKHHSELLFVRSASTAPNVYRLKNYSDFDSLPAAKLLKELNAKQAIGLATVENAFTQAAKEGISREQLMADPVHPNNWGHAVYARTIQQVLSAATVL